jgi:hypothetical protein
LADLKESYPVQVAEDAVNNKIVSEPAFTWWVPHVLKKRDRIIQKVKSRLRTRTHKFGIEVPSSVQAALDIDEQTGTDMWRKAIEKEIRNVCRWLSMLEMTVRCRLDLKRSAVT